MSACFILGAAGSVGSLHPHTTSGLGSVQSQELSPSWDVCPYPHFSIQMLA